MSQTFSPVTIEPQSINPDVEIAWVNRGRWTSSRDLTHIANPATGDLRNKTWALYCTNFQMTGLPGVISGLQLDISVDRYGRIADEQIQLTYQGSPIGKNNFVYLTDVDGNLPIKNTSSYGGPTDLWATELTADMLQDPSFGVILKFQSHPYYPHRCGVNLSTVQLTVY
jgi:hypothetical protein